MILHTGTKMIVFKTKCHDIKPLLEASNVLPLTQTNQVLMTAAKASMVSLPKQSPVPTPSASFTPIWSHLASLLFPESTKSCLEPEPPHMLFPLPEHSDLCIWLNVLLHSAIRSRLLPTRESLPITLSFTLLCFLHCTMAYIVTSQTYNLLAYLSSAPPVGNFHDSTVSHQHILGGPEKWPGTEEMLEKQLWDEKKNKCIGWITVKGN